MCGIFGISYGPGGPAAEPIGPAEMMKKMFPAIVHRGRHAWGYMYWNEAADGIDYFKSAGSATAPGATTDMVVEAPTDTRWLVGHVRAATSGSAEDNDNNHPILHHNIVGVHNGVLTGYEEILKQTGRQVATAKVDSEAIFAAVNKWGMKKGLAKLKGDAVAVFADTRNPHLLRIARLHGRPLVIATTEAGSLIFASEECVLKATGIKYADKIDLQAVNHLWTVRAGKITSHQQFRKPVPITTKPATSPYGYKGSSDGYGYYGGYGEVDRWGGRYVGANRWMIPGRPISVQINEYMDWCWEQKLASQSAFNVRQPSSGDDLGDRLEQALAVVNNNERT